MDEKKFKYHHLGIPAKEPVEGEVYLKDYKCYHRGYEDSEFGIEWMRYDDDCSLPEIVKKVPHIAFEVEDVYEAIKGRKVIIEPNSPSEGNVVAFIEENGAPIELIQTNKKMIKRIYFEGKELAVGFVETTRVGEGVECDVYKFDNDVSKDLGIIRIKAGYRTPLQKVLKGDRTIEGYISGKGALTIIKPSGEQNNYVGKKGLAVEVAVGETMQWMAGPDSDLEVYEICFPPYVDGRFKNL